VKIPAKIYFYSLHFLTPEVKKVPACRRSGKTHDRVLRDPLWPASLRRAARRRTMSSIWSKQSLSCI